MSANRRILISYFFGANSIPLGESCALACERLGFDVLRHDSGAESVMDRYFLKYLNKILRAFRIGFIDLCELLPWGNQNYRRRRLEEDVAKFRPEILLVLIGHGFDGDFLRKLKKEYGIRHLVGWWVKGPRMFDVMLRCANDYDFFYCIHREGYDESRAIRYMPAIALDNLIYRNYWNGPRRSYSHQVVFVGSWSEHREKFIMAVAHLPLEIYGPGWWRKCWNKPKVLRRVKGSRIWGARLINLYNQTRIVLNISSWPPENHSGLNLRVLDVPATGAFLLSENSSDLAQFFDVYREVSTFDSPENLIEKINFHLANPEISEQIAWAGYQRAIQFPNYVDKMAGLLADLSYTQEKK